MLLFSQIFTRTISPQQFCTLDKADILLMCKLCKYFTVNVSFQIETKFTEQPTSLLVFIKKQFFPLSRPTSIQPLKSVKLVPLRDFKGEQWWFCPLMRSTKRESQLRKLLKRWIFLMKPSWR